jgi:hypothetical protein
VKTKQINQTGIQQRTMGGAAGILGLTVAVTMWLGAASSVPAGARNSNPSVLPPQSKAYGKSYGEWSILFWQWAMSIPADRSPVIDPTGEFCDEGQSGPVWFVGSVGGSSERVCHIPAGKAVFMPVFNWIFGSGVFDCDPTVPGVPCDVETLRASAAANTEAAEVLDVTIDGVPLEDPRAYRAISPEPFSVTYPENSIVGVEAGTYYPQVSDGYWLMLAPMSKGEHNVTVHVVAPGTIFGTIEYTTINHFFVE